MQIIQEIRLDFAQENSFKTLQVKQNDYDSRYLRVYLYYKNEAVYVTSGSSVTINCVSKTTQESKWNEGVVEIDGSVLVPIPNWALKTAGEYKCNISILHEEQRLTTLDFSLKVESTATPAEKGEYDPTDVFVIFDSRITTAENTAANANTLASLAKTQADINKQCCVSTIELKIDNGKITLIGKNQGGNNVAEQTIDLTLDRLVVGGRYDKATKDIILELGDKEATITIPLDDMIDGLATKTQFQQLSANIETNTRNIEQKIPNSEKGEINGVATLDSNGQVPSGQLENVKGFSGTIEIKVEDWNEGTYLYSFELDVLTENDAIFFNPATRSDKVEIESKGVFATSNGNIVTFEYPYNDADDVLKPTMTITFNYFIAKGKSIKSLLKE